MAVTNNIKEIREQRGIYQDDLAAAIGYIILHNDNKKISIELKEGIFMAVTNNIREI